MKKITPTFKNRFTLQVITLVILSLFVISCKNSNSSGTSADGSTYTSQMTKSDKKKYFDANENVVYEIKYKPDGFKLRTPSSDLIWKVKLYNEKVKISDNEENLNPYEIKIMSAQEAKLVKDENELARTKMENGTQMVTYKNDSPSKSLGSNYSPTVLVNEIEEIAEDQKVILINELKAKGY